MMSRDWSYYASQIASGLFHPLLMPWYGVFMLFCAIFDTGDAYRVLMAQYLRVTILETVVWTLVVPVVLLFVLLLIGRISSLQMPERKERALPYFVCSLCYVVWCGRLWVAQVPVEWLLTAMGGTIGSTAVFRL